MFLTSPLIDHGLSIALPSPTIPHQLKRKRLLMLMPLCFLLRHFSSIGLVRNRNLSIHPWRNP